MSFSELVAIDIGSSKISAVVFDNSKGEMLITTKTLRSANGFCDGYITDLNAATSSVMNVIYELEKSTNSSITQVDISISNTEIESFFVSSDLEINNSIPISEEIIYKLITKALSKFNIKNKEILHYIPLEFIIDDNQLVENLLGLYGSKIACNIHLITCNSNLLINLTNCFMQCHVEVRSINSAVYASSLAILSKVEQDLGSIMIDIGYNITNIAIYLRNKITYVFSINQGTSNITKKIAKELSIDIKLATTIQILHGSIKHQNDLKDQIIHLKDVDHDNLYSTDITITADELKNIITSELYILFTTIKTEYDKLNLDSIISNKIILTGGGSKLISANHIAAEIFQKNAKIATNINKENIFTNEESLNYNTPFGIAKIHNLISQNHNSNHNKLPIFKKINNWFKKYL